MPGKRLPSLDGLRAVAICVVLVAHTSAGAGFPAALAPAASYLPEGRWGVQLFFYISGFIITYLLLQEEEIHGKIHLQRFYFRRALRILPVYWTYLLTLFVVGTALDSLPPWPDFLSALTFTVGVWRAWGHHCAWVLAHFWSLAVEEQFYLLWPPIMVLLPRTIRAWFLLAIICGMPIFRGLWTRYSGDDGSHLIPFFGEVDSLAAGCLLACCLPLLQSFVARMALPVLYSAEIILAVFIWWEKMAFSHHWVSSLGLFFFFAHNCALGLLIGLMVIRPDLILSKILNWGPVCWMGVLSYSIYIWQQPFTHENLTGNIPLLVQFPYNLAAIFLVATVSYYLIEKPVLRFKSHWKAS